MSPIQVADRLRTTADGIRYSRQHLLAAELALQGLDPEREEIAFEVQRSAVSELLQDIAQRLDEEAAAITILSSETAA